MQQKLNIGMEWLNIFSKYMELIYVFQIKILIQMVWIQYTMFFLEVKSKFLYSQGLNTIYDVCLESQPKFFVESIFTSFFKHGLI